MQLASKIYEAESIGAVQELYHSNGWTDGLPIVPPTEDAVRACLEWVMPILRERNRERMLAA